MAKLQSIAFMAVVCLLAIADMASAGEFTVQGRVYCDTCRAGFETTATYYIKGAHVKISCKSRATDEETYTTSGVTDESGTYNLRVPHEGEQDICEVILVSSPVRNCRDIEPGRDRARILLTHNNGIASDIRYANSLGFLKSDPLDFCAGLIKEYKVNEG